MWFALAVVQTQIARITSHHINHCSTCNQYNWCVLPSLVSKLLSVICPNSWHHYHKNLRSDSFIPKFPEVVSRISMTNQLKKNRALKLQLTVQKCSDIVICVISHYNKITVCINNYNFLRTCCSSVWWVRVIFLSSESNLLLIDSRSCSCNNQQSYNYYFTGYVIFHDTHENVNYIVHTGIED